MFEVGDRVAATKPLRQDGTFPDTEVAIGEVLVPKGTLGEVINIGLYLQEHIIYAVAFDNGRVVGCMTRELQAIAAVASQPGGNS